MTEQIRVGMIGLGGIAQGHVARLLAMPDAEIVGMSDTSEASLERTREGSERLGAVPCYGDHRSMLAEQRPDAVVICTPHTQHFQQAMDSLQEGAHVLLEKPMVCRVADAHTLTAESERSGRVLGLSYQRHTMPMFRYIRREIAGGAYGDVQFVSALQQQNWARATVGSWRQDITLSGGGQINDSGSHLLDIVLWTTGLAPDKVSAFMSNRGTPVDVNTALSVQFTNGAMGTISVVGDAEGWHEDITIWCDHGTFYVRNNAALRVQGVDGRMFEPPESDLPGGSDVDTNFVRAIQGREEIAATPLDGLHTIQLTEAAWRSAAAGGALVSAAEVSHHNHPA